MSECLLVIFDAPHGRGVSPQTVLWTEKVECANGDWRLNSSESAAVDWPHIERGVQIAESQESCNGMQVDLAPLKGPWADLLAAGPGTVVVEELVINEEYGTISNAWMEASDCQAPVVTATTPETRPVAPEPVAPAVLTEVMGVVASRSLSAPEPNYQAELIALQGHPNELPATGTDPLVLGLAGVLLIAAGFVAGIVSKIKAHSDAH